MSWAVAKAKARFSELVACAHEHGPQEITRNGKVVGVLVSPVEWQKTRRVERANVRSMSEFFRSSPLAGSGIELERLRSRPRKVDL